MDNKLKKTSFKILLVIIFISLISACKQVAVEPIEPKRIHSADELNHTISSFFNLKLVTALKQVDPKKYYYERARWFSNGGKVEVTSSFHMLIDIYVFSDDSVKNLDVELQENFEDRLISYDKVIRTANTSYAGAYILFKIEGASCILFRKIDYLGNSEGEILGSAQEIGDNKFSAHLCDYRVAELSQEQIDQFVTGFTVTEVELYL